jgi:hypothetical protein
MKERMQCLMAGKCMQCGGIFDMSYDFDEEDAEFKCKLVEDEKYLCWECRDR